MTDTTDTKYRMSQTHKDRLAVGREQARVVREYLNAINRPVHRGRKRTAESVQKRLAQIAEQLNVAATPLTRLKLVAEQERLERELTSFHPADISGLEKEFLRVVHDYSARKGISYSAWRNLGVPASVLRAAGVSRSLAA